MSTNSMLFTIFIGEVLAEIIMEVLYKKRPFRIRYELLIWCVVSFVVLLYVWVRESYGISGISDIALLLIGTVGYGFIFGYLANLLLYIGYLVWSDLSELISGLSELIKKNKDL